MEEVLGKAQFLCVGQGGLAQDANAAAWTPGHASELSLVRHINLGCLCHFLARMRGPITAPDAGEGVTRDLAVTLQPFSPSVGLANSRNASAVLLFLSTPTCLASPPSVLGVRQTVGIPPAALHPWQGVKGVSFAHCPRT